MLQQQNLVALTFTEFCDRYAFSAHEGVLRIIAKITRDYDLAEKTYRPTPELLTLLIQEGWIKGNSTAPAPPSPATSKSTRLQRGNLSLDTFVRQALHICSLDLSLRNTDQPCRGDIEAFLLREARPYSPIETYNRSLLPNFVDYWKNNRQRRRQ